MTSPLRVGVYVADQNPGRDRSVGITTLTTAIVGGLDRFDDLELRQLTARRSLHLDGGRLTRSVPWRTDHAPGRVLGDVLHPIAQRGEWADVWWYPKGFAAPLLRTPAPTVGLMNDAIVQHYADHHPTARSSSDLRYWVWMLRRSLARFDRVITSTVDATGQLRAVCERYGITPPPITAVGAPSPWEHRRNERLPTAHHVVHFASTAPHKRTAPFVEAWLELARRRADLPELVLVGVVSPRTKAAIDGSDGRVRLVGWQSDDALHRLVATAVAVVVPSEIEGFGLPTLEAAYAGTPVVFTAGTAMAEVAGPLGAAGAIDRLDAADLGDALDRVAALGRAHLDRWCDDLYARYSLDAVASRVHDELLAAAGR